VVYWVWDKFSVCIEDGPKVKPYRLHRTIKLGFFCNGTRSSIHLPFCTTRPFILGGNRIRRKGIECYSTYSWKN